MVTCAGCFLHTYQTKRSPLQYIRCRALLCECLALMCALDMDYEAPAKVLNFRATSDERVVCKITRMMYAFGPTKKLRGDKPLSFVWDESLATQQVSRRRQQCQHNTIDNTTTTTNNTSIKKKRHLSAARHLAHALFHRLRQNDFPISSRLGLHPPSLGQSVLRGPFRILQPSVSSGTGGVSPHADPRQGGRAVPCARG